MSLNVVQPHGRRCVSREPCESQGSPVSLSKSQIKRKKEKRKQWQEQCCANFIRAPENKKKKNGRAEREKLCLIGQPYDHPIDLDESGVIVGNLKFERLSGACHAVIGLGFELPTCCRCGRKTDMGQGQSRYREIMQASRRPGRCV